MNIKKIIFLVVAALFLIIMVIFALDVAKRTTFPGQKQENSEQIDP